MANQQESNIDQVVDTLNKMSVLDLSKLKKVLEETWDVKAAAGSPMMMAAPPVGEGGDAGVEESTEFDLVLESFPADKKIAVIKVLREITGVGLKEAKELAEGAPKTVANKLAKNDAEEAKNKLSEMGAKVTLKGL